MNLKKINLFLALALMAGMAKFMLGQATSSSSSTAPSSQTAAALETSGSAPDSSATNQNDSNLTQQLQSKFSQDPAFANVQVSVTNHSALITGSVASKADKKRAKDLAKSVGGVKHVKDQLTVSGSSAPGSGSGSSSSDNGPIDAHNSGNTPAGNSAATSASSASVAPNSTTEPGVSSQAIPSSGQTSATASSATPSQNAGAGTSTVAAMGENPASAPQNPGTASNKTNMAGEGPVAPQSAAAPPTAPGGVGAASVPNTGVGLKDAATLQSQIQNALQTEPTLKNDSVNVSVNDSTIELSGNVQTGKEKETAYRIASSFAENRRVKDRITVSGRGAASSSSPGTNPTGHPNGNLTNPTNPQNPSNQQNPSANNPAANGDASANPR